MNNILNVVKIDKIIMHTVAYSIYQTIFEYCTDGLHKIVSGHNHHAYNKMENHRAI